MLDITLRAYTKEIDDLIEHESLDEAIAHCRHILQTYPKHLETYRLLGKAYLEAKRYGDAADIFQRVLSAIPDDFVSHVGMAIVREDEGNLESAIWHMERAFETNPANPAIQQEIRRLIGRRDGLEPHKVRLTRGALARMYVHGELYPQAIVELRSALQEDADRPDLEVLLAEMYWQMDQTGEAVALCKRILDKLPYCLEANRILAAILHRSNNREEAVAHIRRLASLEPYIAFLDSVMADPRTVDAGNIRLKRLEWQPGQPLPLSEKGQPDWAASLGVELRTEAEKEEPTTTMPAWLDIDQTFPSEETAPTTVGETEETPPFAEPTPDQEGQIPEWMREVGWGEATGEGEERPLVFSDQELQGLEEGTLASPPPETGELADAQIPGWLQSLAPEAQAGPTLAPEGEPSWPDETSEPLPSWLQEDLGAEADQPEGPDFSRDGEREAEAEGAEVPTPKPPVEDSQEIPTWLDESPGSTDTIVTWLSGKEHGETIEPPEGIPEWMRGTGPLRETTGGEEWSEGVTGPPEGDQDASVEGARTPGWLSGLADAAAQEAQREPEEPGGAPEGGLERAIQAEAAPPEEEGGPEWLRTIAQQGAEAPEAAGGETDELQGPVEPETAEGPTAVRAAESDWLQSFAEVDDETSEVFSGEDSDWLKGLTDEGLEAEEMGEAEGDAAWLQGVAEAASEAVTHPPSEEDREAEGTPEASAPSQTPEWLQEISEAAAEPTMEPEERPSGLELPPADEREREEVQAIAEAPDWLADLSDQTVAAGVTAPPPAAPSDHAAETVVHPPEKPAPTEEPVLTQPVEEPNAGEPDFDGALGWLKEPAQEVAPEPGGEPASDETAPDLSAQEDLDDEEIFRWLEGLAARQGADEAELVTPPEERPTEAPSSIGIGEGSALEERAFPEKPEEGLEWLEKLAAERGIDVDITIQEPAPTPTEQAEAQYPPPQPPVAEAEVPDWLQQIAAEDTVVGKPKFEAPAVEEKPEEAVEEELPPWLYEAAGLEEAADVLSEPTPEEHEVAFDEVEVTRVAAIPPEPQEEIAPPQAERPAEIPERAEPVVQEVRAAQPPQPEEAQVRQPPAEAPAIPHEEVPEPTPVAETEPPTEPERLGLAEDLALPEIPEPELEIPDWLRELPVEAPSTPTAQEPEGLTVPSEAISVEERAEPGQPKEPAEVPTTVGITPGPPAREEPEPIPEEVEPTQPEIAVEVPRSPEAAKPEAPEARAPTPPSPEPSEPGPPEPVVEAEPIPPEVVSEAPPPAPEPAAVDLRLAEPEAPIAAEPEAPAAPSAEAAAPEPRPEEAKKAKPDPEEILELARKALASGDFGQATKHYNALIKKKLSLNMIAEDLQVALNRNPNVPRLWQALGDAYMKNDQVSEAIEAYRRGMEVA